MLEGYWFSSEHESKENIHPNAVFKKELVDFGWGIIFFSMYLK